MQEFHLLSWAFGGRKRAVARAATSAVIERAHNLLEIAGVGRAWQRVETMSRGKMHRVAIARALLRRPGVIVADEPTASLDAESGDAIGDLLLDLAATEARARILSGFFSQSSGVNLPIGFAPEDGTLAIIFLVLAALPAVLAYRQSPAQALRA